MDLNSETADLIAKEKSNNTELPVNKEQICITDKVLKGNKNICVKSEIKEESDFIEYESDLNEYDNNLLTASDYSATSDVKNELNDKEYISVVDINNILTSTLLSFTRKTFVGLLCIL